MVAATRLGIFLIFDSGWDSLWIYVKSDEPFFRVIILGWPPKWIMWVMASMN
jgi:hypothetical protein